MGLLLRLWPLCAFALALAPACGETERDTPAVPASEGGAAGSGGTRTAAGGEDGSPVADGGAAGSDSGGEGGAAGASGESCSVTLDPVLTFTLDSGAFPNSGHPDVAVHVPPGFRPCERPGLIAFFAGFNNCATNAIGSVDAECTPGAGVRRALDLQEQLDAANVNAILVVIELGFDNASSDPGALASPGAFRDLLSELLAERLSPLLGESLDVDRLDRVVIGSFSGGYTAAARVASVGAVDVAEIDLYDSLFGLQASFEAWLEADISSFDGSTNGRRFVDLYSPSGGTDDESQALAAQMSLDMMNAGLEQMFADGSADPFDPSQHSVIFRYVETSHVDVPKTYFGTLAKASGFATLR